MRFVPLLLLSVVLLLSSSCKKGCTKSFADNYDPKAKIDDASCLTCEHAQVDSAAEVHYYIEYNAATDHYAEPVLRFVLGYSLDTYAGNDCKRRGLTPFCISDSSAINNTGKLSFTYANIIGDTIVFDLDLYVTIPEAEAVQFQYHAQHVVLPPLKQSAVTEIAVPCVHSNQAFMVTGYNISSVQYRP